MTTFLLKSGHGIDTPGKRSPSVPPGILEYEFNQDMVSRIIQAAPWLEIIHLNPEAEHITLKETVRRANNCHRLNPDCVFIAIHANASPIPGWSSANGAGVFVSTTASYRAAKLARALVDAITEAGEFESRGVRGKDLYVLKYTSMPAVLVENGFMTNRTDATKLASDYWRDRLAHAYVEAMLEY
jgi:N-acetylmuramoyl-L-alanine amidase